MGLDVYAGPMTRYFSGDWQTAAQKFAAENGLELVTVRQGEDPANPPERAAAADVQKLVTLWRDAMLTGLSNNGIDAEPWNESLEAEYRTDKPAWDTYGQLLVWAAYAERSELSRPTAAVEDWEQDPAYRITQDPDVGTAFVNLLCGVEVWLPIEFDGWFQSILPTQRTVTFGSLPRLQLELDALNEATWHADADTVASWRRGDGIEHTAPLESKAQFAFSIFHALSNFAVTQRTPMLLDY